MSLPKTITIYVQIDYDSGHREFEDFSYAYISSDEDEDEISFEEWVESVSQKLIDANYARINGRTP
jgi:hypothetical protein